MNLVLASSSPRRQELLTHLDIPFTVTYVDIDERILDNEMPTNYISRMVKEKAKAVCSQIKTVDKKYDTSSNLLIVTADTIGVLPNGHDILVKPKNKADAFSMWKAMSGCEHYIWTAVQATIIELNQNNKSSEASFLGEFNRQSVIWQKQILEKTKVEFIELTEGDMQGYWQTGEPVDKAGGYAIQGKASAWVNRIEGSYSNVVGLPLAQTKLLIEEGLKKI